MNAKKGEKIAEKTAQAKTEGQQGMICPITDDTKTKIDEAMRNHGFMFGKKTAARFYAAVEESVEIVAKEKIEVMTDNLRIKPATRFLNCVVQAIGEIGGVNDNCDRFEVPMTVSVGAVKTEHKIGGTEA